MGDRGIFYRISFTILRYYFIFDYASSGLFYSSLLAVRSSLTKLKKEIMLDFTKKILEKVSFDRDLFSKELKKAVSLLKVKEAVALYSWCLINFGDQYRDTIVQIFAEENLI
jgi:hypothetical protein